MTNFKFTQEGDCLYILYVCVCSFPIIVHCWEINISFLAVRDKFAHSTSDHSQTFSCCLNVRFNLSITILGNYKCNVHKIKCS